MKKTVFESQGNPLVDDNYDAEEKNEIAIELRKILANVRLDLEFILSELKKFGFKVKEDSKESIDVNKIRDSIMNVVESYRRKIRDSRTHVGQTVSNAVLSSNQSEAEKSLEERFAKIAALM